MDAWAGAALIRVGPRGYHELILLHGLTEIALLPSDPGSTTDVGVILDDHYPRRIRYGPTGEQTRLYHPANARREQPEGTSAHLIRSDNGCEHARLLEVTATADGVVLLRGGRTRRTATSTSSSSATTCQHRRAAVERQGPQRITDSRVRRQHADRADSAARHGRQRAVDQRGRVDGRADRRGPVAAARPSNWWTRGRGNGSGSTANPAAARWSADSPSARRWRRSPRATG